MATRKGGVRLRIVWLDGDLVPADEARVSPFDRGLLLGDGVFETVRAYDGHPFALDAHVARLRESARLTGIPLPDLRFARVIRDVLSANGLATADARVRLTVTAGVGGAGLARDPDAAPTVLVTAVPVTMGARAYAGGVHVVVARGTRRAPASVLDPRIKSLNYLPNVLAHREARARGAFDALLLTVEGVVAEATTANVFLVTRDGALETPHPDVGILDGITRRTLIDLARRDGIEVRERRDVAPTDVAEAREAFLTGSVAELVPVTRFEDAPVGDGAPGPVTKRLLATYRSFARTEAARATAGL